MRSALVLLFLAQAGLSLAGSVGPEVGPERARELERLVRQDCGGCHGYTLAGGLGTDIRPEALAGHSRESLVSLILDGIPGTPMPPWRPLLTPADAEWIAEYLLEADSR
jgi:cytochrome c55X